MKIIRHKYKFLILGGVIMLFFSLVVFKQNAAAVSAPPAAGCGSPLAGGAPGTVVNAFTVITPLSNASVPYGQTSVNTTLSLQDYYCPSNCYWDAGWGCGPTSNPGPSPNWLGVDVQSQSGNLTVSSMPNLGGNPITRGIANPTPGTYYPGWDPPNADWGYPFASPQNGVAYGTYTTEYNIPVTIGISATQSGQVCVSAVIYPLAGGQTSYTAGSTSLCVNVTRTSVANGAFTIACTTDAFGNDTGAATATITSATGVEGGAAPGGWLFIGSFAPGSFGTFVPSFGGPYAGVGSAFTIPAADLAISRPVNLFIEDPNDGPTLISSATQMTPLCNPPPTTATCGAFSGTQGGSPIDPEGDVQPGTPFKFSVGVSNLTGTASPGTYDFKASVTNPSNFSPAIKTVAESFTQSGNTATSITYGGGGAGGAPITVNSPGLYTLTWYFNNGATPVAGPCTQPISVGDQPYLSVTGGDVIVGSPIYGLTAANSGAGILAFNNNGSGNYQGAGDNLAAFAASTIDYFVSDDSASPTNGYSLSFANTPTPSAPVDGGNFGTPYTTPSFYSQAASIPGLVEKPAPPAVVLDTLPTLTGCKNNVAGGVTTTYCWFDEPPGDALNTNQFAPYLPAGARYVIFVQGDVEITSNITLSNASWTGLNNIPSLYIIAQGNIYIAHQTTSIQGVYIAEPTTATSNDGDIFTCVASSALPGLDPVFLSPSAVPGSDLYTVCDHSLNVTGSFIARQIRFERTAGTVGNGTAAESFTYDPSLWLVGPFVTNTVTTSTPEYTDSTALPPVL